jgi:hypothetical protein
LPLLNLSISTDQFQMTVASADQIVGAVGTLLAVDIPAAGGGLPVIASGRIGNVPAVRARVGRNVDTIRRRRDALVEEYSEYGL